MGLEEWKLNRNTFGMGHKENVICREGRKVKFEGLRDAENNEAWYSTMI